MLAARQRELEVLCEALRLMKPVPTPPLTWVRDLCDRRDQLVNEQRVVGSNLRNQLVLVIRLLRRAWQGRIVEAGGLKAITDAPEDLVIAKGLLTAKGERLPGDGSRGPAEAGQARQQVRSGKRMSNRSRMGLPRRNSSGSDGSSSAGEEAQE